MAPVVSGNPRKSTWRFRPAGEFRSFSDPWRDLNAAGGGTPLLDPCFLGPLVEEFDAGQVMLGIYGDQNAPQAMGLFSRESRHAWETFQPANAPIGPWVHNPGAPLDQLLADLVRALPGLPLLVALSQQDPDLSPRPGHSRTMTTFDYIRTARITVNGTFDAYWAARGKNLRHNMKRQRNRLDRDGVKTRLAALTAPGDMAAAIAEYGRLESSGWKAEANSAVDADDAQGRFYRKIMEAFCERGEGIVYQYFYNDALAASDICIQRDGTFIVLKTTYDEGRKGTSPAQLMRHEAFQRLFEAGTVRRIEFYGPVKDWHTKWTDEIRTMYHVNVYRWPIVSRFHKIAT